MDKFIVWQAEFEIDGVNNDPKESENSIGAFCFVYGNGDKFSYSVKVVNPERKSDYIVQKLRVDVVFESISELKEKLVSMLQGVPSSICQVGYM